LSVQSEIVLINSKYLEFRYKKAKLNET